MVTVHCMVCMLYSLQQNIRNEDMAVCLLEMMFGNKSLSVQDQMSMLFEILSLSRQYNFPAVSYH